MIWPGKLEKGKKEMHIALLDKSKNELKMMKKRKFSVSFGLK